MKGIYLIYSTLFFIILSFSSSKFFNNLYHSSEEIFSELDSLSKGECQGILNQYEIGGDELNPKKSQMMKYYTLHNGPPGVEIHTAYMIFGEHSRELVSSEEALYLIKVLCGKVSLYDKETINFMLDNIKFVIVPIVNVYGRDLVEKGDYCKRTNENDVDLNRNWDSHWKYNPKGDDQYSGEKPFSEWETRALVNIFEIFRPDIFITTHSGTLGMFSPFAYKAVDFSKLSLDESKRISSMLKILKVINKKYCNCKSGGLGNELWYLCPGTCLDYAFENFNVRYTFAFEIFDGNTTNPHFLKIINNPDLKGFSHKEFLIENENFGSVDSFLQANMKMGKLKKFLGNKTPFIYEKMPYYKDKNFNESCFSQTMMKTDNDDCKKQMTPMNFLHLQNTLINWVNVYFEIFSIICLHDSAFNNDKNSKINNFLE